MYIDSCGAIASDQKSLRIIASLCKYHRLNSPGIIISNFACPDLSKKDALNEYTELITDYLMLKDAPNDKIEIVNSIISSRTYEEAKMKVENSFQRFYGDFITTSIIDIAALALSVQRFVNSNYVKSIMQDNLPASYNCDIDGLNDIKNNSLFKFIYLSKLLECCELPKRYRKLKSLIKCYSGIEGFQKDIFTAFATMNSLKENKLVLKYDIASIKEHFDAANDIYQFLDKPNSGIIFDLIINQFAYPLHYNSNAIKRYQYKAKQMEMFVDIIVLDECRYIYEWLPAIHQIKNAFSNLSWQYIFRFALDGLVKQRINYNNEYFFQGSVVSKDALGFEGKLLKQRINIQE